MEIFMESALSQVWLRSRKRSILKKLKIDCHGVLISSIACMLASSGCSSVEDVQARRTESTNFAKETESRKPANPRVHPGQPYIKEIWLNP